MLRIVGFASGSPVSVAAMGRIAETHQLLGVVAPPPAGGLLRRAARALRGRRGPLGGLGVPLLAAGDVAALRPDLVVVASFPARLQPDLLATGRLGALNLHMSLLPRHRGADPVFSTYWDDDRQAGVSVHWMDAAIDAGDLVAQAAEPLPRGLPSTELYMRLTARGVDLLAEVLGQVEAGTAPRHPQDAAAATSRSLADIARARVPLADWPAERVWHVLAGLGDRRTGLLDDAGGRPLQHGPATAYRLDPVARPGRVEALATGFAVHARDGIVTLAPAAMC